MEQDRCKPEHDPGESSLPNRLFNQEEIMNSPSDRPYFKGVFPISGDPQNLPVKELGPAIAFYTRVLGFQVEGRDAEHATLRRDDAVIGLTRNQEDPEQASCYFAVENLDALHHELTDVGLEPSATRLDNHGGKDYRVFFAKEPYGVCFCFGTPAS
jgi:lactoylglutathione lyase